MPMVFIFSQVYGEEMLLEEIKQLLLQLRQVIPVGDM